MKLGEKVRLVLDATLDRRTHWTLRGLLFCGLWALAMMPVLAVLGVIAAARGRWVDAFAGAVSVPVLGVFWAAAWRRAVDVPMGDAWFALPSVAGPLVAGYLVLAVLDAVRGSWGYAVLNLVAASVFWPRGHGGGGWDDPIDAPRPDPSTAA